MLYLISGQPGNGKTLRAMALTLEAYEADQELVKAGKKEPRHFYSNIQGSTLEDNPDAFPWMEKMPSHNDWTKLEKGSWVVYDEAHSDGATQGLEQYGRLFPSTGKPGESDDPRIRAMSTSRSSFSIDLVFVTQWPNKIHHQVRTLIGQHIHMNRAMGLQTAGMFTWSRVQVDPYDERAREKSQEEIWHYPKGLYKRYLSSTIHTTSHKFKMPKKAWQALSMLIVACLCGWLVFAKGVPYFQAKYKEKAQGSEAQGGGAPRTAAPASSSSVESIEIPATGTYTSLSAPRVPSLIGCVDSDRGCRCWDDEGALIDQSESECRLIVDKPLPINVLHEYKTGAVANQAQSNPVPQGTETASPGTIITGGQVKGYGDIQVPADTNPPLQTRS